MDKEMKMNITELRHHLHAHPELSMQEKGTKEILISFLERHTGLEITDRGSWFYACYRGEKSSETIAFRADMDALPMDESIDLLYASRNPGVSHKCGHDGHCAALAGFAVEMWETCPEKTIYFIFQPGEETGDGGRMCAELAEEKGISQVYAFHNMSGFPLGTIRLKEGITQCASRGLVIRLTGVPAHASQPEDGKNPCAALARLVLAVETLEKENIYDGLVLATVVHVRAGDRNFGIAAYEGEVAVTLRAYSDRDLEMLEQKIRTRALELAAEENLEAAFILSDVFPETVNNGECTARVRRAAQAAGIPVGALATPFRASEDFGWYLKKCPGAIFYIGNGEDYPQVHTKEYDFNDQILETAIRVFAAIVNS